MKQLILKKNILKDSKEYCDRTRDILKKNNIFCVNLMGGVGTGKTSLIEKIFNFIEIHFNMGTILGDLYTIKDGERLEDKNILGVQINTGATWLDTYMVNKALDYIDIEQLDLLIIENVGGNQYPNKYDLGEDIKIAMASVCEGSDKIYKYPSIFNEADIILLNKIDIINNCNFDRKEFYDAVETINKKAKVFEISCSNNKGIDDISDYLISCIREKKLMK